MHEKDAFESLTFQRPLPRHEAGDDHRYRRDRRDEKIVVGGRSEQAMLCPLPKKIKQYTHNEQRDGKVNQHHMLCVLGENYRFYVERMQEAPHSLHHDFAGHLRVNRTEVRISSCFTEREGELLVCIQHFGLKRLWLIRAHHRVGDIVSVDPRHRGSSRYRQGRRPEAEIVDFHFRSRSLLLCTCENTLVTRAERTNSQHQHCCQTYKRQTSPHCFLPFSCICDHDWNGNRGNPCQG